MTRKLLLYEVKEYLKLIQVCFTFARKSFVYEIFQFELFVSPLITSHFA